MELCQGISFLQKDAPPTFFSPRETQQSPMQHYLFGKIMFALRCGVLGTV